MRKRIRITVRQLDSITRFTRTTIRTLHGEIKLLWHEFPGARSIEVEVLS